MEVFSTPFGYVAALSASGLGVAAVIHFFGWFMAPERITPLFENHH